ncbi:MAG: PAS domain-containing protein, partial [Oceanicaulis sp.]
MVQRDETGRDRSAILEAIASLQSAVIAGEADMRAAFDRALQVLLDATGSKYGFIGQALSARDGTRYLQTLAISDIARNAASRELAAFARKQGLAFRNLDTLFGAPMKDGATVRANDAPNDPRAGAPPGDPPLDAFLGLPLVYAGEMVGLAGLANRKGGYDAGLVGDLAQLASALAAMIVAETAKAERDRQAERAQLAVQGSDAGIWDWDVKSGAVWWSASLKAMLGVDAAFEPDFDFFLQKVHPGDREALSRALNATLQHDTPYRLTCRLARPDGEYATIRTSGHLVRDGDGAPERLVGVQVDISREIALERKAREAGAVAEVAAATGLASWRWNTRTDQYRFDERLCALLDRPEFFGRDLPHGEIEALVHPDDRALVAEELQAARGSDRHAFRGEHRVLKPDREVVWLQAHGGRIDDETVIGVVEDRTAAKLAELETLEAKERYELAITGSLIAVFDWCAETDTLYWSDRFLEMLGLERSDFGGRNADFIERVHPDDLPDLEAAMAAHLADKTPYDTEFRMRHTDGRWVTVRCRGAAKTGPDGALVRMSGSILDITGEVLARARADLAIEAAGLGIWEWDLSTSIMTADPRFAAMLGRPWLAGQPGPVAHPLRFIHDEDRAAARAWINDLEAGRIQRAEFEHRVVKPDGEMVWLVGSASVTESGHDGRPRKVLGVFEDRTARKTAEMELAEAKLRYDVAVAGSHAAIWDQNLLTNEIYWTARLGEILGLGAEARTETLDDFLQRIHPDDIAFARENARRAIETREPLDNVLRIRRSDGVYRRLRSRAGVMYDPDGRPVRICGSITDITGELEAQARARLSGRRAEMALQAAHLGVWDYDAETGAVTADATLATLFGAPEIAGRTLTVEEIQSFTHPDDLNRVRADLARLHQTKAERVDNEHRVLRRDGTEIWVRADVGVAERDADGGVRRLIGIVQDLSGVKL